MCIDDYVKLFFLRRKLPVGCIIIMGGILFQVFCVIDLCLTANPSEISKIITENGRTYFIFLAIELILMECISIASFGYGIWMLVHIRRHWNDYFQFDRNGFSYHTKAPANEWSILWEEIQMIDTHFGVCDYYGDVGIVDVSSSSVYLYLKTFDVSKRYCNPYSKSSEAYKYTKSALFCPRRKCKNAKVFCLYTSMRVGKCEEVRKQLLRMYYLHGYQIDITKLFPEMDSWIV